MALPLLYLVDDHPMTRAGLRLALEGALPARVVGESADAETALERLMEADDPVDLVLVDVTLTSGSGLDLVRRLQPAGPPALVVSMHAQAVYARRARDVGACGFVSKTASTDALLRAVRAVLAGRSSFPDDIDDIAGRGSRGGVTALSDREIEVFALLGRGYAPRHIAEALALSVSTVEGYRQRIRLKLGVPSAALLTRHAVSWVLDGATTPPALDEALGA